ncbi:MAG: DUF349 domain-containing protein [Bacteroidetes bacterium]|nr:MAG: DUF349 domain-containing protein [Bacteroidota bacterium]
MNNLNQFGYAQDGKIYLNAYMDFPKREIGVVKETEEASLLYFIKRYELAEKKVEEIKFAVEETQNKGSYLMKLLHLRTYLAEFDGLGDFPILFNQLDEIEAGIREYIKVNRQKNLEIKRALLLEVKELCESHNWNPTTKKLKELKLKWIKTGAADSEFEADFNKEFDQAIDRFFERRAQYIEEKNRQINERITKYQILLLQIQKINKENTPNAFSIVKSIQSDWKAIGVVPKIRFGDIQKIFKSEIDTYFAKSKRVIPKYSSGSYSTGSYSSGTYSTGVYSSGGYSSRTSQNPLDQKKDFCEQVEKMLLNPKIEPSIEEVKKIQNVWKKIGKLKSPLDKEYNTRFKIACNEIFESYFLDRVAHKKYDSFENKTHFEQIKIKIRLLKDSIKEDETMLSLFNEKIGKTKPELVEKELNLQKINQINKLKTKNRILKKLQDQLLANY